MSEPIIPEEIRERLKAMLRPPAPPTKEPRAGSQPFADRQRRAPGVYLERFKYPWFLRRP
jgi:hypothetical protein